jgi:hypothetical protein
LALENRKEISSVNTILPKSGTNLNFQPAISTRDLEHELRYLEGQLAIQRSELSDLLDPHRTRPYRPEFITTMRKGYRSSLRQLHSEMTKVRVMLERRTDAVV